MGFIVHWPLCWLQRTLQQKTSNTKILEVVTPLGVLESWVWTRPPTKWHELAHGADIHAFGGFLDPFPLWWYKLDIWVGKASRRSSNAKNWSSLYCRVSALDLPSATTNCSLGWQRQSFGPPPLCRKRIAGWSLHAISVCMYTSFMSVKQLLLSIHGK